MNLAKLVKYYLSWIVLFSLLTLSQLQRIQINQQLAVYVHDFFIIGWLVFYFGKNRFKIESFLVTVRQKIGGTETAIITFLTITTLINYYFRAPQLLTFLYLGRIVLYTLFCFCFINAWQKKLIKQRPTGLENFTIWDLGSFSLLFTGLTTALIGLIQYLLMPDSRFLKILGWDDHYYRLIGPQLDPNFTGIIIVMTLILILSLENKLAAQKTPPAWIKVILSLFCLITLALTFSRASYLSLIICTCGLFLVKRQKKIANDWLIIIMPILLGFFVFLAPKPSDEGVTLTRTAGIQARLNTNQLVMQQLTPKDWIIGQGFFYLPVTGNITEVDTDDVTTTWPNHANLPDNLTVLMISNFGLLGLIGITILAIKWGIVLLKKNQVLFFILLAIFIHSQFNNTLFQPTIFILIGLLTVSAGFATNKHVRA